MSASNRKFLHVTLGATALLSAAALVLLPGCQTGSQAISRLHEVDTSKYYAVTAEKTPFYQHGPQQGSGPDRELPRDTLVNLVRHSFGYAKVQLVDNGQQGYVAAEDIRIAPAMLVATLTATPAPEFSAASGSDSYGVQTDDPSFVPPPPEGLPEPDLPPAPAVEPTPLP
jgi:hypothetical protein